MATRSLFPRSMLRATILLVLVSQSLLGCAPPATRASPTSPVPSTVPTDTQGAISTAVPTTTPTPFVPKATVKVAVHVPLSGPDAAAGTDIQRAAEMAVDQLSGPLNELGYQVQLAAYDDQSEVKIAVANANEIVADPQILCGVGHYYS